MKKITQLIFKIRDESSEKGNEYIDQLIRELTKQLDSISNSLENADWTQAYLETKTRKT